MADPVARERTTIGAIFVILLAYLAVSFAVLSFMQSSGLMPPVWPAAGIAFAAVYVWGWKVTPAIVVGSFSAHALVHLLSGDVTATSLAISFIIACGAAAQALVGVTLVAKVAGHRLMLTNTRDIVPFLVLGGAVATTLGATLATVSQVGFGVVSADTALSLWVTYWTAAAIGVLVFAPITLMLIPSQQHVWRQRRLRVAIPSLIAVSLLCALCVQINTAATNERDLRLNELANNATRVLDLEIVRHQEAIESVSSFFESSDVVDSDEFRTYANDTLDRSSSLEALSYNPLISRDEREEFENYQRDVQAMGDYQVTERNDEGDLVAAGVRDEYVPVAYVEPRAENQAALGFDINSNPARKRAIDQARATSVPAATEPIDLVQESGGQKGMLALIPIFDRQGLAFDAPSNEGPLIGFAVGVYRLGDLLSDAFIGTAWDRVDVRLVDVTNGEDGQEVAYRESPMPATIEEANLLDAATKGPILEVYGRQWQVEATPTSGGLAVSEISLPIGLGFLMIVGMTLLQAFLLLVTGLEREARRQATDASHEASTDVLTGLQNRRAFMRNLAGVRERSKTGESSDLLMAIDLDHFKRVNDEGGHDAGDKLLQQVAAALSENLRSRDVVARIGGDEFAVILNNCSLPRGLDVAQELVTKAGAASVTGPHGPLSVGLSVGITTIQSNDDADIDELLRQADSACYEAKRSGGGFAVFDKRLPTITKT